MLFSHYAIQSFRGQGWISFRGSHESWLNGIQSAFRLRKECALNRQANMQSNKMMSPRKQIGLGKHFKLSITDRNSGSSHLNLIITCIVLEK